jgi:hypothetical protein
MAVKSFITLATGQNLKKWESLLVETKNIRLQSNLCVGNKIYSGQVRFTPVKITPSCEIGLDDKIFRVNKSLSYT